MPSTADRVRSEEGGVELKRMEQHERRTCSGSRQGRGSKGVCGWEQGTKAFFVARRGEKATNSVDFPELRELGETEAQQRQCREYGR